MAGWVRLRASGVLNKGFSSMQDATNGNQSPMWDRESIASHRPLCSFSGRKHPWLDGRCKRHHTTLLYREKAFMEKIFVRKKELHGVKRVRRDATCRALSNSFGLLSSAGSAFRNSSAIEENSCTEEASWSIPDVCAVLQHVLLLFPVISALATAPVGVISLETRGSGAGYHDKFSGSAGPCSSSASAWSIDDGKAGPRMFRKYVNQPKAQSVLFGRKASACTVGMVASTLRWREFDGRGPHSVQATSHHHHWHGGGSHHVALPRPKRDSDHYKLHGDRWSLDDSDSETMGVYEDNKLESPSAMRTVKISRMWKERRLDNDSDSDAIAVGELEAAGLEKAEATHHIGNGSANGNGATNLDEGGETSSCNKCGSGLLDALAAAGKEPMYQVMEVTPDGKAQEREVSRRQLLKCASLRMRDIRRIDPSLWVTNSLPALLVRDDAILLNLGSLRAVATTDSVLVFDHNSIGGKAFLECLLNKIEQDQLSGGPIMPFELEVLEAALASRLQRLEEALMKVEPRVKFLLQVLPTKLNADFLEELRISKQALVELGSKAGALRQTLLELLEHNSDIRRITNMGRSKLRQGKIIVSAVDKRVAEEEEQEVEMLLEYHLQRCDSIHGQSERLLDSAKEAEDSIAVNLSSRRLEVSKLELLLQVGTFCTGIGALIAGIFGMNLRSRLEEHAIAFWIATGCIVWGGVILFAAMLFYLMRRRIL